MNHRDYSSASALTLSAVLLRGQTADGLVRATFTWKRKLTKDVIVDPAQLVAGPMEGGTWPKQ
jgi:hypothetical protein